MKKDAFEKLKGSLREMVDHSAGKLDLRNTSLPRSSKKLTGPEIARLCSRMKVSRKLTKA